MGYEWFGSSPDTWDLYPDYISAKKFVKTTKFVNNLAERRIKDNTEYAKVLTNSLKVKNLIPQEVEGHRQKMLRKKQ